MCKVDFIISNRGTEKRSFASSRWLTLFFAATAVFFGAFPSWGVVLRKPVDGQTYALNRHGRDLRLECEIPGGPDAEAFLAQYLLRPSEWRRYAGGRGAVAIPFENLKPETQRALLLALFEDDYVTEEGWWHVGLFGPAEGREPLSLLCEWLTGAESNEKAVMDANGLTDTFVAKGQKVLIPWRYLRDAMKKTTRAPIEPEEPIDLEALRRSLSYHEDEKGPYAVYKLQQGEALYTAVVVRFTDFREDASIRDACKRIQKRSGIADVRAIKPGAPVRIPVDMLADRFKPEGSADRREYEAALEDADRLRGRVRTKDLDGVVVILDPGHGGSDHGAANHSLYEDEINYDIACRIKQRLEAETRAKVYMTLVDPKRGFTPTDRRRFEHEPHEELLTTPRYDNGNWRVSANLRAYLANDIFEREVKNGTDAEKVVFTSVHCDALFNASLRGAMVYIPAAKHRKDKERPYKHWGTYDRYAESARDKRVVVTTLKERRFDEALSRNFAAILIETLGQHRIKRHNASANIRSVIRRDGGQVFVPAVLRLNKVPTKVLIEAANMTNATDRSRLADPWWREQFAKAYVSALKTHFGS